MASRQHLAADDLRHRAQERLRGHVDGPQVRRGSASSGCGRGGGRGSGSSRPGASRKSSALRVGGVSTTTRSKSLVLVQLVELLGRHVLLRARQRAGDVAVEAVGQDALGLRRRRRRSGAPGRRRSSWCRASRPTARPATCPSIRGGSLVSPSASPRASARRLAGSMVTTTARRPRRAASRARRPPSWSCRRRPSRSR